MSKKTTEETLLHELVPPHVVLSSEQRAKVLEKYHATDTQFPKILSTDPALRGVDAKVGDLIQIKRKDTNAEYYYYRLVVSEEKKK